MTLDVLTSNRLSKLLNRSMSTMMEKLAKWKCLWLLRKFLHNLTNSNHGIKDLIMDNKEIGKDNSNINSNSLLIGNNSNRDHILVGNNNHHQTQEIIQVGSKSHKIQGNSNQIGSSQDRIQVGEITHIINDNKNKIAIL